MINMQILLGIDYGSKKLGLALATSKIAEPLRVVRFDSFDEVIDKISIVIKEENIE